MASTALLLFGLGTLVVYLTLWARYESFVLSFILLLAVLMALLGACAYARSWRSRHSVGTTVFARMIMSTVFNLFYIPVLYLVFEQRRERRGAKLGGA